MLIDILRRSDVLGYIGEKHRKVSLTAIDSIIRRIFGVQKSVVSIVETQSFNCILKGAVDGYQPEL